MIAAPTDPIQEWRDRIHGFALQLMDENIIISVGMNTPNNIVTTPLSFEPLDSERKLVARQLGSLRELTHMRLDPWLLARGIRRLKRITSR